MTANQDEPASSGETQTAESEGPSRRERIVASLASLRSVLLSTVAFLGLAAVLIVTVRDLTRAPVVLEEISVPGPLREQGYTGLVASNLLWDAIEDIRNFTGDSKKRVRIQTASRQLDVVEPGSGLSLQRLTQVLRALFNLPQTRIAGEFACPVSE